MKQQVSVDKKDEEKVEDNAETSVDQVQVEIVDQPTVKEEKEKKEDDDVKDSWDADTTEDEQEEGNFYLIHMLWSYIDYVHYTV